jgi:recombination protein RecT
MNDLATLETQLVPLRPHFAEALGNIMPVERLTRTLLISCERNPKLLECSRQSLINSAMSAAVLGLEIDGVTGQAFLIPFKQHAQLVVGYKGYNTLGARAGITITGGCAREGDEFSYALGSDAFVRHVPTLAAGKRITAAWAAATAMGRKPIVTLIGIDELMAVKARSPGAKKPDSPWNDPAIGFPAMCEKTAKRRLARSLPLTVITQAAAMEEAFEERGLHSWIEPQRGVMIEGKAAQPTTEELISPGSSSELDPVKPARGASAAQSDDEAAGGVSIEERGRAAAKQGRGFFNGFYKRCTDAEKQSLNRIGAELAEIMEERNG